MDTTSRTDLATMLTERVRRAALIPVVRAHPEMTFGQLDVLLTRSKYGSELGQLTIGELLVHDVAPAVRRGEGVEDAAMRVFRENPESEFASSFFARHMGLKRWTAQALLAGLAERGLLVRLGRTSNTRYRLATTL